MYRMWYIFRTMKNLWHYFPFHNQSAWDLNPKGRSKGAVLITSNDPTEKVLLSIPAILGSANIKVLVLEERIGSTRNVWN